MREIIGENLDVFMKDYNVAATLTYSGNVGYWSDFQVWQMKDDVYMYFSELCDVIEEDRWKIVAGGDAWWRGADGSVMGCPDTYFTINGSSIVAWRNEYSFGNLMNEFDGLSKEEKEKYQSAENYADFWSNTEYNDILEYFCDELGASTERNVCALAVDLAMYNNMTVAKLFTKYYK